jgi:signal transduction histidine kinase/ActR/RegA family two-component response regulator
MTTSTNNSELSSATLARADQLFADHQRTIYQHTDRLFAVLMVVQWVAGIAAALWIGPRTWMGTVSQTHIHVWAAIFLGAAINAIPIALAVRRPGATSTRYAIATGQMMMSALLIHLTGGRIETHFHVFGSLAFLAFYRDWRVLVPATVVVAADHILRGAVWPESVYGVLAASQWRWLEHAGWVLFEDSVLYVAIKRSVAEMWDIAVRTAQANDLNECLEQRVADRTAEIVSINDGLEREIAERKGAEEALQEANQRALTEYERLVERIAALGQTLGNARDLNTIFRSLRDFAVISLPCDRMLISLYDLDKETRRSTYCWVDNTEFGPKDLVDLPVKDVMTEQAIQSGTVLIDNQVQQQIRAGRRPEAISDGADERKPESALAAPMTVMGRTVGCVEIQSYQAGAYEHDHATAIRMAANLAATAVENVNLIEREHSKEEQLRQSQKMEAVGQLAGGVAHDFNNLLTAITGYSELTLRDLDDDSPFRPKITEIKKAGERAASLTRQLLAFSRKQILQPKVLDLNAVIPEMDKMLRRLIGENIVLKTLLDNSLGQVKADPGQIEQILMNLCINARDALPHGGHLTIETSNVDLQQAYSNQQGVLRAGHYVMLSVSDDGCGMSADTQARIFEPFFTTKELGKGTGLGLSTVYGIVKQSEGNIWVYSEVDRGTTFKIFLPRVDEVGENEKVVKKPHSAPRGNETVLLVEDEEIVRVLCTEILEKCGYQVVAAANGEEGLRLCMEFEGRIDLMITDVVMPHMSGRELAENLARLRPETQVLYMSGFTDDAIVRHGVLDEGVFFIQKPFSPDALAVKARQVLDHAVGAPGHGSSIPTSPTPNGVSGRLPGN